MVTPTEREDKDSSKGLSPGSGQDEGSFFIPSATLHEHEGLSMRLLRTATRRASCLEGRRQPRGVGPLLREGQGTDCHIPSRRTLVLEGDDNVLALYLVFLSMAGTVWGRSFVFFLPLVRAPGSKPIPRSDPRLGRAIGVRALLFFSPEQLCYAEMRLHGESHPSKSSDRFQRILGADCPDADIAMQTQAWEMDQS